MSKLRVPPSVKMVLGWSRAWWGDHRHSKQHAVPKEIDEAEPDCEKGSSGQCDPCPTVCRALQKSSQPHGMLLHYSTNTIGSGGQEVPGSAYGQGDTGSKSHTGSSSDVIFIECFECASFSLTFNNTSMGRPSIYLFSHYSGIHSFIFVSSLP